MCTFVSEYSCFTVLCLFCIREHLQRHMTTLTEAVKATTNVPIDSEEMCNCSDFLTCEKTQEQKCKHTVCSHTRPYNCRVGAYANVHAHTHVLSLTLLHKSMCWSFVSAVCVSCEGFAKDSSEHSTGFLSSLNTWREESA